MREDERTDDVASRTVTSATTPTSSGSPGATAVRSTLAPTASAAATSIAVHEASASVRHPQPEQRGQEHQRGLRGRTPPSGPAPVSNHGGMVNASWILVGLTATSLP